MLPRRALSAILAIGLILPNSADAQRPEPLPLNHIWRGVLLCSDGPRGFELTTVATYPQPLVLVILGPKSSEPHTPEHNGLMLMQSIPDPDGITLVRQQILLPAADMPSKILARIDPPTRKFYGGVNQNTGCDYVEALQMAGQDNEQIIQIGLRNPEALISGYEAFLRPPQTHLPSAKDIIVLGLLGATVMGLIPGVTGGGTSRGGGGAGYVDSAPANTNTGGAPSVGGNVQGRPWGMNVHGHVETDVQGNPW